MWFTVEDNVASLHWRAVDEWKLLSKMFLDGKWCLNGLKTLTTKSLEICSCVDLCTCAGVCAWSTTTRSCCHLHVVTLSSLCFQLNNKTCATKRLKLSILLHNNFQFTVIHSNFHVFFPLTINHVTMLQLTSTLHCYYSKNVKVKEVDLHSACIVVPHCQGVQVGLRITQFLPANYTVPASTS